MGDGRTCVRFIRIHVYTYNVCIGYDVCKRCTHASTQYTCIHTTHAHRHKIRNPERMRTAYGKLMYFLQDATSPTIEDMLGFNAVRPIKSVYEQLQRAGDDVLAVLKDPLVGTRVGVWGVGEGGSMFIRVCEFICIPL